MEELEQEIIQVKAQNEKLKNENALLKENARVLLEENRKLLKHKQDTLNQQQQISNEIIPIENQIIGSSLKRKINPMTLVGVADESAVFINTAGLVRVCRGLIALKLPFIFRPACEKAGSGDS